MCRPPQLAPEISVPSIAGEGREGAAVESALCEFSPHLQSHQEAPSTRGKCWKEEGSSHLLQTEPKLGHTSVVIFQTRGPGKRWWQRGLWNLEMVAGLFSEKMCTMKHFADVSFLLASNISITSLGMSSHGSQPLSTLVPHSHPPPWKLISSFMHSFTQFIPHMLWRLDKSPQKSKTCRCRQENHSLVKTL